LIAIADPGTGAAVANLDFRRGEFVTALGFPAPAITLQEIEHPIDFALMDIWEMARPAIELIAPHFRRGAIVIADNTGDFDESYAEYFDYVRNPGNAFTTQTLPFAGGLEMTVKL
jgi:predicted O-methyltransferase YrrM